MIGEAFEFGRHAPFVIAAYAASIVVIAALIVSRRNKLRKALDAEGGDHAGADGAETGNKKSGAV